MGDVGRIVEEGVIASSYLNVRVVSRPRREIVPEDCVGLKGFQYFVDFELSEL